jgi:hypothetical protein
MPLILPATQLLDTGINRLTIFGRGLLSVSVHSADGVIVAASTTLLADSRAGSVVGFCRHDRPGPRPGASGVAESSWLRYHLPPPWAYQRSAVLWNSIARSSPDQPEKMSS